MISIIQRYSVGALKLNRLRFEAQREDRGDTGMVTKDFFKQMQKRFGMSVSSADQRDMFAFFQIGLPLTHLGSHFGMRPLDKLVDHLA
jgi:uncharacterized protein YlxP (DUF503 family)